ncbi:hypothetical protein GCM10010446_60210 [Streptomyces enissocaesilis]|uniref:Uncharacterized protein n=1 Tax=Streptomyces enissocaesilis TaxID=332589 RepID=A0ABN3XLJ6_9ACTN
MALGVGRFSQGSSAPPGARHPDAFWWARTIGGVGPPVTREVAVRRSSLKRCMFSAKRCEGGSSQKDHSIVHMGHMGRTRRSHSDRVMGRTPPDPCSVPAGRGRAGIAVQGDML